ncbi:hypothetical protein ACQW5G_00305 [Fructilactobacillus sp. Tb1]|uniref:hypothetical protein n=1 Tax=Fructilactobacillus sp. Tb1 TaxID=3422304 RepID=UPI003D2A8C9A
MNNVEIAVEGRLDKVFADYPLTPRLEMLKIEFKRSLIKDANTKVENGDDAATAVEEAFQDFGDLRHQINEVLFSENN